MELGAKEFLIQWLLFNNEIKFEYGPFFVDGLLISGMIVEGLHKVTHLLFIEHLRDGR